MDCRSFKNNLMDLVEEEVNDDRLLASMEQHMELCRECREMYHLKLDLREELLQECHDSVKELGLKSSKAEVMEKIDRKYYNLGWAGRFKLHVMSYYRLMLLGAAAAVCLLIAVPKLHTAYNSFSAGSVFSGEITRAELIKHYIPHPFSPKLNEDSLEFKGRWKGNVMPGLTQEMEKQGWKLYDGMGAKVFYKRNIKGKEVRISLLPMETGGPLEANSTTFVKIELEK